MTMHRQHPTLLDRRMLLAGGLMVPAAAMAARLAPPDVKTNESAIRWPISGGRELHGFMAIPARARGRQPAVLVIGGPDTSDDMARALARSVAQAGFIACAPNKASFQGSTLVDDMRATAGWLAHGLYGTGRIGAIGMVGGAAIAKTLQGDGTLAAIVTFDDATPSAGSGSILAIRTDGTGWRLSTDAAAAPLILPDWAQAWERATAYLREHLT
jgi:dienelactone hydrolase